MPNVPGALLCDNSVRRKEKVVLLELKSVLKTVPEFVSQESVLWLIKMGLLNLFAEI